jgi:hypothetical protein
MDINEKALRMLKHMRRQIFGQAAADASVRDAARSVGVKPEGREFDALVEELLRGGYISSYSSPTLTAYGLYRLNDSGISAADGAENRPSLRKAPKVPRQGNS